MLSSARRTLAVGVVTLTTLAPAALLARPASAFPKGDSVLNFNYKVVAVTHIKRSNQTVTPPPGTFKGGIDLDTGKLAGNINLPPATFSQSEAGIPLVTVTAATVQVKPVSGHIDLSTLKTTSTSVFSLRIKSMYAALPQLPFPLPVPVVNLVGNSCMTESPISVTMTGTAHLSGPSKFSGTFSIPNFVNCGAMTAALNQEIPGPGNTFTATVTPV